MQFTYNSSNNGLVITELIQYALREGLTDSSPEGRQPPLLNDADGAHCDLLILRFFIPRYNYTVDAPNCIILLPYFIELSIYTPCQFCI